MMRIVLAAALLAGCSKGDSGPPCDKVVDHMMDLMKQMMPGHDQNALGDRKQMIDQCKQRNMTAKTRKCLVDAKTFNDLAACNAPSQPAIHKDPESAPAPRPATGSAAPGSSG
jgi:hypothetical protein